MSDDKEQYEPKPFDDVVKKLVNTPPRLKFSRVDTTTCPKCNHQFPIKPKEINKDGLFIGKCPNCGASGFAFSDPDA